MQPNNLDDFLKKYIEGYLFADLQNIKDSVDKDHHPGNGAYLMTAALCAGIELMGYLLKPTDKTSKDFDHYCKHYLGKIDKKYEAFAIFGRNLIRNGIDHTFATKGLVGITRQGDRHKSHLVRYASSGVIVINPDFLYEDFKKSYYDHAFPRINGNLGDLRQHTLNQYEQMKARREKEVEMAMQNAKEKIKSLDWHSKDIRVEPDTLEMIENHGEILVIS